MADEPEHLTLKILREMREGFERAFGDLAELRGSVSELQVAAAAIRADQGRTNELLEQVHKTQQKTVAPPRAGAVKNGCSKERPPAGLVLDGCEHGGTLIPAGVATPRENGGEKHEQRAFRSGAWR